MGGGGRQRCEVRAEQVALAFTDGDVGFLQTCAAGAQALYFPPFEHEAGLELLLDEVVVPYLAVDRDRGAGRLLFSLLLAHGRHCSEPAPPRLALRSCGALGNSRTMTAQQE